MSAHFTCLRPTYFQPAVVFLHDVFHFLRVGPVYITKVKSLFKLSIGFLLAHHLNVLNFNIPKVFHSLNSLWAVADGDVK